MRISNLASVALAACILPLASPAYAGCGGEGCVTGEASIIYGNGTYGASSHSSHSSFQHSNQTISTRYGGSTSCPAGSTRASDGFCMTSGSGSSVGVSSASSASGDYLSPPSIAPSFGMGSTNVVPFTSSSTRISQHRIDGMASDEFLSPTTCPTSVYNPQGAQVLGCYSVVKPVPKPVYRPAPIVIPQVHYQQVRVVRPIIYVRYPVPTPVPVYQYNYQAGRCSMAYARFAHRNMRRSSCGGW